MTEEEKDYLKIGSEAVVKPFGDLLQKPFGPGADEIGQDWAFALAALAYRRRSRLRVASPLTQNGLDYLTGRYAAYC